jgi:hypothetical protein
MEDTKRSTWTSRDGKKSLVKNILHKINSILETIKENVCELEHIVVETIQNEVQRTKSLNWISVSCGTTSGSPNIHGMGVLRAEKIVKNGWKFSIGRKS